MRSVKVVADTRAEPFRANTPVFVCAVSQLLGTEKLKPWPRTTWLATRSPPDEPPPGEPVNATHFAL